MRGKKYFLTLAVVYLTYLTHGIQAIVISQNLEQFAIQWSTDAAGVYGVIALTGLAKFFTVWICGEISDKIGRKPMILVGAVMYILFFTGLLTATSVAVAGVCAFLAGTATSFFDGAEYPAAQESWPAAPGSATILIKGFISVSGLIYPLLVASLRASGSWQVGIIIPIVMSVIVLIIALIAPYSYDEELKARRANKNAEKVVDDGKKNKLDADAQRAAARFIKKPPAIVPIGCAIFGFIAMATMYSAQQLLTRYGRVVVEMSDMKAASLTSLYTAGSLVAVLVWATFMSKFRWRTLKVLLIDVIGSVFAYALVCLVRADAVVQLAAVAIGFFAAGGALQCGVTLMQEFNPGNKGRNLGIYYTFMGAASYAMPVIQSALTSNVGEGQAIVNSLLLNLGLAIIGVIFMLYLAANYKTWFGVSFMSPKAADE